MILHTLLKRVEDFIIPPLCVVCDAPLADGDRWFCPACIETLAANSRVRAVNACPRCSQNRLTRECGCEFAWDFSFDRVWAAYDYDDVVRTVARHVKYKGKERLARRMGTLAAAAAPQEFLAGADMVIPVPLHRSRLRRRGYNQAEAFARGVLDSLRDNYMPMRTDLLFRVRNTGTQTKLDKDERQKNLSGAFAADPRKTGGLNGKSVILADDILTTGATAETCTDALLAAGCSSVRVLSMGRR